MKKYPYINISCAKDLWYEIKLFLTNWKCKIDENYSDYSENLPYLVSNFGNSHIDRINIGFTIVDSDDDLRYKVNKKEEFLSAISELVNEIYIKEASYLCFKFKDEFQLEYICRKLEKLGYSPIEEFKILNQNTKLYKYITINIVNLDKRYYSLSSGGKLREYEEVFSAEEFLGEARLLPYYFSDIYFTNSEIKKLGVQLDVGNVIIAEGRIFTIIPLKKELGVIEYLGKSDVMTLTNFIKNFKNEITEIYDVPETISLTSGNLLWREGRSVL